MQVLIEATRGNGFRGDIAIDDVMLLPGKCPAGISFYIISVLDMFSIISYRQILPEGSMTVTHMVNPVRSMLT